MIKLGDKIILHGLDCLEPVHISVVKKIVGSYARNFLKYKGDYDILNVSIKGNLISASISAGTKSFSSEAEDKNLFFALSAVLNDLNKKIRF